MRTTSKANSPGAVLGDLPKKLQDRFSSLHRVSHYSRKNRANRMKLILEGGHNAEVAAAAPQAPEQIRVLGGTGRKKLTVGFDKIDGEKIVAAQAVFPDRIRLS